MVVVAKTSLPRIGLGMAALGRPGYINLNRGPTFDKDETAASSDDSSTRRSIETMQSQANNVMGSLLGVEGEEAGNESNIMPWFDCARSYGLSEKFVGEFLREKHVNPQNVFVSSKWGYTYVADWKVELAPGEPHEVKDHSVENFLKQVEETKQHIGEYLNLYQVHSATFDSGILTDQRVHEALASYKKENGWSIGLSVSGTSQDDILREAMKIEVDGSRLFDSVQCTYNVFEQRPAPALLEAHEAGMDIIIKEGMANGRVLRNEQLQEFAKKADFDCSVDALALACILSQPFQPRVLSGAVTPEQLQSNMKAVEISEKLMTEEKELLNLIMSECVQESEQYWNDRSALAWN